eukprot:CAMPEP_0172610422 /NCGR_PEP_ID=MMETSP1068-20121228/30236_1 /TAXON_ID=35684 /ORGANISM="Pseudopedinella elastica, Strain CCMP716" /LENGTH=83 /DNA_ID=CAMNT_0013414129 /DNA_START=180 /DNA_END=428 /DNA_ORIENTATION=-
MHPLLTGSRSPRRRVATYMAGFEGVTPQAVEKVTPAHQPDAKWPVFLFALGNFGSEKGGDELEEADPSLSQAEAEAAAADEAA